jgi:hypothetical protein
VDGFEDTTAAGGVSRVHVEVTATDFDVTLPTVTVRPDSKGSITMIDIGTIIQVIISSAVAMPTVHVEKSADGWDKTNPQDPSTPESSRYRQIEVSDDSWTKDLQTPQTTAQSEPQAAQPPATTLPSKTITDFPPPPAITYDGVTIRPVAVTFKPTVVLEGGVLTTSDQVVFQVAVGSSTLSVGTPITINNMIVGVTVDAAGSTVVNAGDITTTLPKPVAGEVRTVAVTTPESIEIMTAVFGGTTKYIIDGQTLAPGQPVTIGDTPISITTSSGQTVLIVGNTTTTLAAAGSGVQTITDWATASAATQGVVVNGISSRATSTSTRSDASTSQRINTVITGLVMGMAVLAIAT